MILWKELFLARPYLLFVHTYSMKSYIHKTSHSGVLWFVLFSFQRSLAVWRLVYLTKALLLCQENFLKIFNLHSQAQLSGFVQFVLCPCDNMNFSISPLSCQGDFYLSFCLFCVFPFIEKRLFINMRPFFQLAVLFLFFNSI